MSEDELCECEWCYAVIRGENYYRHVDICPIAVEALANQRKSYWR